MSDVLTEQKIKDLNSDESIIKGINNIKIKKAEDLNLNNDIKFSKKSKINIFYDSVNYNGLIIKKVISTFDIKKGRDRGTATKFYADEKDKNIKIKVTLPTKRFAIMLDDHNAQVIIRQYKLNQIHETEFRKKLLNLADLMENETDISADRETIVITCTLEEYCDLINCHNVQNAYYGNTEFFRMSIKQYPFIIITE